LYLCADYNYAQSFSRRVEVSEGKSYGQDSNFVHALVSAGKFLFLLKNDKDRRKKGAPALRRVNRTNHVQSRVFCNLQDESNCLGKVMGKLILRALFFIGAELGR